MRIAIDATAAATQFAGVGRYTRELLRALVAQEGQDEYRILCAAAESEVEELGGVLPPGQWREIKRLPLPERFMTAFWQRLRAPLPVDILAGDFEVFHGPDFVLPPTRKRCVVTVHDLSFLVWPELAEPSLARYLSRAVPHALKRADGVIAVSASVAAELVDAYPFVRDKVRAIPNGVSQPSNLGVGKRTPGDPPTILIVGTIEPRKNHLGLIDAMPAIRQHVPDARLVIAGRVGWQSEAIMERIRHACAMSIVEFVESPSDDELRSLYATSDVFVYPSFYEGFGLPVLEAMSFGIPVVASDIPALRETAGSAALFADQRQPESIAEQVCTVINDPTLVERLVSSGYERVRQHTWQETARRTRAAYADAAEGYEHVG